jgi:zona occludens toxin (predicted ATPase)
MVDMFAQMDSITLITGKPGSGKTLRAVRFICEAVDRGEQVFVTNFMGLQLLYILFENPHEWQMLPAGSVLVVDEAQRFFWVRRGGDPPLYIQVMETIRHLGVRLLLIM